MHLVRGLSQNHGINMHLVRGFRHVGHKSIHLVAHYIFLFLRNDALFAKVTVLVTKTVNICQCLSIFGQYLPIFWSYRNYKGIASRG